MSKMKIKFKSSGFREILLSSGVNSSVTAAANGIQARANANAPAGSEGFGCKVWKGGYGGGRWVASVTSLDKKAAAAESENKVLSKAVSGSAN